MPLKNGKAKKWLFNRKYMLNSLRMLSDITKDLENHLNDDADYMESLGKTDSCNYFKGMADAYGIVHEIIENKILKDLI